MPSSSKKNPTTIKEQVPLLSNPASSMSNNNNNNHNDNDDEDDDEVQGTKPIEITVENAGASSSWPKLFEAKQSIIAKIDSFFTSLREFSFIFILMSYTAIIVFIFACILYVLAPPSSINIVPIIPQGEANNSTNLTLVSSSSSSFALRQENRKATSDEYLEIGGSSMHSLKSSFDSLFSENNNNDNNSFGNFSVIVDDGPRITFIQALFLSLSAFTGSGLAPVTYSVWNSHIIVFLGVVITFGSYVLLTLLPAVFRYFALKKERTKLEEILLESDEDDEAMDDNGDDGTTRATAGYSPVASRLASSASPTTQEIADTLGSNCYGKNESENNLGARHDALKPLPTQNKNNNNNNGNSTKLSFGKRIVYEDGLAHVNQEISICVIIVASVVFYWFCLHVFFITIILASGKPLGWAVFTTVSAFNNAGMTLSPDSMIPLANDVWLMIVITLAMAMGNPLFPIFFRFQTSLLHRSLRRITQYDGGKYATSMWLGRPLMSWRHSVLLFLRYPRKYYTHMFRPWTSLVFFGIWLAVTIIGMLLFLPEVLRTTDGVFPPEASAWQKLWIGFFQCVAVRSTGFNIVDLNYVWIGHLTWWLFAMYTAAYPFIVVVRASQDNNNTSESAKDKSNNNNNNNIDQMNNAKKNNEKKNNANGEEPSNFTDFSKEATGVLGRDLVWLYISILIICYAERTNWSKRENFSIFLRVCFEVASAFGNVGLSLSLPNTQTSFCGSFSDVSLFILIILMYCGKHRNFPHSLDEAISIRVRKYDFSSEDLDPDFADLPNNNNNNNEAQDNSNNNIRDHDNTRLISSSPPRLTMVNNNNHNNSIFHPPHPDQIGNSTGAFTFFLDEVGDLVKMTKRQMIHRRVRKFYEHYNPERLIHIERILAAFENNPGVLLKNLATTYGPEPNFFERR